ncbi:MAG: SIR2 family protein [Bacteroidales bacterium]|nr:SIR2 family protein [Bacteroidales bacterium]
MDDKPLHWEKLEKEFENGHSIVLFLGAGVNFGSHGEDFSWDALINHLLLYAVSHITHTDEEDVAKSLGSSAKKLMAGWGKNTTIEKTEKEKLQQLKKQIAIDSAFSRDMKTTIVKQRLGNAVYVRLIRDYLYRHVTRDRLKKSVGDYANPEKHTEFHSLNCIADLILRNRNIQAVVTQNFDQFLCDTLKEMSKIHYCDNVRNIEPKPIHDWTEQSLFSYNNINIYHVHGYIPRYDEIQPPKGNKIVMSMDEFYEDTRNVYSWQIASQLHFLSQYTCIFCGLSLDDYTNQRLLHYVKNKHQGNLYYLTAAGETDGSTLTIDRIKNEFHEKNGLTVLYDKQGYEHLYGLLKDLQYE